MASIRLVGTDARPDSGFKSDSPPLILKKSDCNIIYESKKYNNVNVEVKCELLVLP